MINYLPDYNFYKNTLINKAINTIKSIFTFNKVLQNNILKYNINTSNIIKFVRFCALFFLILNLFSINAYSNNRQDIIDLPKSSKTGFEGRHFFVGFMQNEMQQIQGDKSVQLKLFLAASGKQANVTIKFPDGSTLSNVVPANGVSIRDIGSNFENRVSEVVARKGIEIISDEPITVYGYSSQYTTSDLYTAIPVANLGTEYRVVCMPNDFYAPRQGSDLATLSPFEKLVRPGMFLIVAQEDNTRIEITPTAPTEKGMLKNSLYTITLNKGETYLVKSQQIADTKKNNDLTGSSIVSTKPVAVFSGHARTAVPQVDFFTFDDSKDHIIEMMPPITTWGNKYYTGPYGGPLRILGSMYKLVAAESNTVIDVSSRSGVVSYTLDNPGDFISIDNLYEEAEWKSTKPFLLTQFMTRAGADNPFNATFDPSFSLVTPANQYINSALFRTPKNNISDFNDHSGRPADQYLWHKCMLVVEDAAISNITINGSKIAELGNVFYKIGFQSTGYSYVIIDLAPNTTYKIQSERGKFSGIMYGGGAYDSYSNPLGSLMANTKRTDNTPPNVWANETCGNLNGVVSDSLITDFGIASINILPQTVNFLYNFDQLKDTSKYIKFDAKPIDRSKDGVFTFEFRDKEGFGKIFRYDYKGIKVTQENYKDLETIFYPDKKCFSYKIKNESNNALNLNEIKFSETSGIGVEFSKSLPYLLKPNETIDLNICVASNINVQDYLDRVEFIYDCELEATLIIEAKFKQPALQTENYDFGLVRVGDTVCTDISWVNQGDVDLIVKDLTFLGLENSFNRTLLIDTVGLFPVEIKVGETFTIKNICFTPNAEGDFNFDLQLNSNFNIYNNANLIGKGGAPKIEIADLDWGYRRIGTNNDTTITLVNNGTYKAVIEEITIKKTRDDNKTETTINSLKNITINPGGNIVLNLSFTPEKVDEAGYLIISTLKVDWQPHELVIFEITGQPTLPEIYTRTIDMGTCIINQNTQGRDSLMFSVVDLSEVDSLSINMIEIISGDINSFELSTNYNTTGKFENRYQRLIDINFKPTKLGYHFLKIGVRNDGLPNYQFKVDTVTIIGNAIPADTIGLSANFISDVVYACDSTNLEFDLTNFGNKPILIRGITLNSNDFDVWFENSPEVNYSLQPNESKKYEIGTIILKGQEGNIDLSVLCEFETLENGIYITKDTTINISHFIKPIVLTLAVDEITNLNYKIGDEATLKVTGVVPYDIDTDLDIRMNLKVSLFDLVLRNFDSELIIYSSEGTQKIPVKLTQNKTELLIDINLKEIYISADSKWEINFTFLKMLNTNLQPEFTFEITGNRCFEPNIYTFFANVEEVCVFNLRNIEIFANLTEIKIAPNPISYFMKVDFTMPVDDDRVKFVVYSISGEKICEFEKNNLKKGEQSIIFEFRELTSMNYILSIEATQFTQQTLFSVSK